MDDVIAQNIEKIEKLFNIELRQTRKCRIGCCPIHRGDNDTAFNFYNVDGHTLIGNWVCNTSDCNKVFGTSPIGFIRGLLSVQRYNWSRQKDKEATYAEAMSWCQEFLGAKNTKHVSRNDLSYIINRTYKEISEPEYGFVLTPEEYKKSGLKFPDPYFLKREYKEDTLLKFGIGCCTDPSKPMYQRSIVPLYSREGNKIIGCSGRSLHSKCHICNMYHGKCSVCPSSDKKYLYPKWKHSNNFPSSYELYNLHNAKQHILETGLVILTEGSPNVWRLFEAGFPMSLASFGTKFTHEQKKILDNTGANTIIIVPDADSASKSFVEKIIEQCKFSYNIVTIEPSYEDDIGKCNVETVKKILLPFIEKYQT